ncbi:unnamed protein product [Dovyalis caffra]|uniref:Phloem protein 2 n=1 Tax=Dovyalis caffra TaxID=77055 RepID=A0AAV1RL72_9ROSI|nr:unnamed protein product [Dovyalis caffra]
MEHIDEEIKVISISLDIKGSIRVHIHHGSLSKLIIYRLLFALKMSEAAGRAEAESDKNKCRWSFKPRELHITWSENPSNWKMPEKENDPAELQNVCWLEINSSTPEPLSKGKRYALSFKISLSEQNFGWDAVPAVYMLAKVGKKGRANWAKINIADMKVGNEMEVPYGKLQFEVPKYAEDTTLHFGLYELWSGGWKGGLRIHEAVVEKMPSQINQSSPSMR